MVAVIPLDPWVCDAMRRGPPRHLRPGGRPRRPAWRRSSPPPPQLSEPGGIQRTAPRRNQHPPVAACCWRRPSAEALRSQPTPLLVPWTGSAHSLRSPPCCEYGLPHQNWVHRESSGPGPSLYSQSSSAMGKTQNEALGTSQAHFGRARAMVVPVVLRLLQQRGLGQDPEKHAGLVRWCSPALSSAVDRPFLQVLQVLISQPNPEPVMVSRLVLRQPLPLLLLLLLLVLRPLWC
mmetsp:Transcript_9973/g.19197  ORF Transcript_9973/g.19197 Transcript_9973/m.19197 type:complete len:234 (+) Transcript_9973:1023-1724(+)